MKSVTEPLSFAITPDEDVTGGDTVIGPNKTEGWKSEAISDALFPPFGNDVTDEHRKSFEEKILAPMKKGLTDIVEFTLVNDDMSADTFLLAFAPVTYTLLRPINPSDFAEGVEMSSDVVYSVGIGKRKSSIKGSFYFELDHMNEDLNSGPRIIFMTVIGVVTTLFVMFTIYVSRRCSRCIMFLCFFAASLTH